MFDRMSPAQRAEAQQQSGRAADRARLAIAANGHEVTRVEEDRARTALVAEVGKRKADKLQETALRQAGARPKGLGRLFG
jgi:hypothetical protein